MNRANEHSPLDDGEKQEAIEGIAEHLSSIMKIMRIDTANDHNSEDSPRRIAKSWVNDLMRGRFSPAPSITSFPNHANHNQMVLCGPIRVVSMCSHHWSPFIGEAFVAYIPKDTVIGLSKLSRIVDFYARRPQIQEELTQQIADEICLQIPDNQGVAVLLTSAHQCMTCRGVEDAHAKMTTSELRGAFFDTPEARKEFFDLCSHSKRV
jgi:GTP cyclohydrolase IA